MTNRSIATLVLFVFLLRNGGACFSHYFSPFLRSAAASPSRKIIIAISGSSMLRNRSGKERRCSRLARVFAASRGFYLSRSDCASLLSDNCTAENVERLGTEINYGIWPVRATRSEFRIGSCRRNRGPDFQCSRDRLMKVDTRSRADRPGTGNPNSFCLKPETREYDEQLVKHVQFRETIPD